MVDRSSSEARERREPVSETRSELMLKSARRTRRTLPRAPVCRGPGGEVGQVGHDSAGRASGRWHSGQRRFSINPAGSCRFLNPLRGQP